MKGIGIGESDFKGLRLRDNYYIDKTLFIKHVIDNESRVALITRPRRFGKTLNMSTLRYFLDCNKKDSKELFEGLKIMEQGEKYTSKLGAYPCIYITLKDTRGTSYENMMLSLQTELVELFIEHSYLLKSEKLNDLNSIMKDLITLNLKEFRKKFQILAMEMFSYMDVGEETVENFYHAFVLGMLVSLKDTYYVNSNRESGMGRYDIMLEPKDKNGNSFIMEFKVLEDMEEKTIEETIVNAKKQIEEKKYETNLRERGFNNITKIVFAFKGKEVKMEVYE